MDTPKVPTSDPGLNKWIDAKKASGQWLSDEDFKAKKAKAPMPVKPFSQPTAKPWSQPVR